MLLRHGLGRCTAENTRPDMEAGSQLCLLHPFQLCQSEQPLLSEQLRTLFRLT